jgi:hypothetical protein
MRKQRNTNPLPPLQPEGSDTPQPAHDPIYSQLASALAHERAKLVERDQTIRRERNRHASIETLTLRMISQLEQQVADLRGLYFQSIKVPIAPLEKK